LVKGFIIEKDFEFIGLKKILIKDREVMAVVLKNPQKFEYGLKVTNHNDKLFLKKKTANVSYPIDMKTPGAYTVRIVNFKTKNVIFKDNFIIKDKIVNNTLKDVLFSGEEKLTATLKWKKTGTYPKENEYKIKIYSSGDLNNPIIEEITTKPEYRYESEVEQKIFWSVESLSPDITNKSNLYETYLKRPAFISLPTPKIILLYNVEGRCYVYNIPASLNTVTYNVNIFSSTIKENRNWKRLFQKNSKSNSSCFKSKGDGKYYYSYSVIDKWGRTSPESELGDLYFPISPLDDF